MPDQNQMSIFTDEELDALEGRQQDPAAGLGVTSEELWGSRAANGDAVPDQPSARERTEGNLGDFGEKIGGARKDVWRERGLISDDLEWMNEAERKALVKKANVWKKPDYQALFDSGIPREVVWYYKRVRDAVPTKPQYHADTIEESERVYIDFVREIEGAVMSCKTLEDIDALNDFFVSRGHLSMEGHYLSPTDDAGRLVTNKLLKAIGEAWSTKRVRESLSREVARKRFLFSEADLRADHESHVRSDYIVTEVNDRCGVERSWSGSSSDRVQISGPGWTRWARPPAGKSAADVLERGTWLVINGGQVIASNLATQSEARRVVDGLVSVEMSEWDERQKEKSTERDSGKKRKVKFKPTPLTSVKREGEPTPRGEEHVYGQDIMEFYDVRGGEFGNWMPEAERQQSLDLTFDAFHDLARALNIRDEDVSIGGRLSIAFGARGVGGTGAVAHYEPMREVINITRMKGAGSLAHEWCHALDDISGKDIGYGTISDANRRFTRTARETPFAALLDAMKYRKLVGQERVDYRRDEWDHALDAFVGQIEASSASLLEPKEQSEVAETLDALRERFADGVDNGRDFHQMTEDIVKVFDNKDDPACRAAARNARESRMGLHSKGIYLHDTISSVAEGSTKTESVPTQFYKDAEALQGAYTKAGHGYWTSDIELLARAGAAYIADKCANLGIKDGYLTGHAEGTGADGVHISPQGEERKTIGAAFDRWIGDLKERGLVYDRDAEITYLTREGEIVDSAEAADYRQVIYKRDATSCADGRGDWCWSFDELDGAGQNQNHTVGLAPTREIAHAALDSTAGTYLRQDSPSYVPTWAAMAMSAHSQETADTALS